MKPSFENKVVWITGASSGIGEALSYEFARLGARLILSARNEQELNRVKQNSPALAANIFILPLNLCQPDAIAPIVKTAFEKWGRLDIVIHNAGLASRALVEDTSMEVYRKIMETNYFGPVALTRAVLPYMKQARSGHFVVISSLSGEYGVPKLSAYAASKHALHGFFESLRAEVTSFHIRVSIVIPGFVNTPIITKALNGQGAPMGKNMTVNEKGISPQRCAQKIVQAIRQQKVEALIGRSEMFTVYLHRFFPNLFPSFISNHPVKKLRRLLPFLFK